MSRKKNYGYRGFWNMGEKHKSFFTSNFLGGRNDFNFKIPLIFLCLLALAGSALAAQPEDLKPSEVIVNGVVVAGHVSTITISPPVANCSQLNQTFIVNVKNSQTSVDDILQVEIYKPLASVFTGFTCGSAPSGWNYLPWPGNDRCIYVTQLDSPNRIFPGNDLNFTFSGTALFNPNLCFSQFTVVTVDDNPVEGFRSTSHPKFDIDCTPPRVLKTLGTPLYQADVNYISQNTQITVSATDEQVCDLGMARCTVNYTVNGSNPMGPFVYNPGTNPNNVYFQFNFNEDSRHDVNLTCVDKAGNSTTVLETDYVETLPPETTKTLGSPKVIDGSKEWITINTPITLTADDPLPHPSGVKETWWKNTIDQTENSCADPATYCIAAALPEDPVAEGWTLYTGTFTKKEDSCHILSFYSIDNLGQAEKPKVNCFYVDDKPPVLTKTVGEPNIPIVQTSISVPAAQNYWVTQNTPITLSCVDQQPHPVDNVTIHWKITVDGVPRAEQSVNASEKVIKFTEDSEHVLDAWCTDALGNTTTHDVETFKVDTTPPAITKTMVGKYLGACPPSNPDQNCFVADNGTSGVSIAVKDGGAICAVDQTVCTAQVWWQTSEENCRIAEGRYLEGWCLLDSYEFGDKGQEVLFRKDSTHKLIVNCKDSLGNAMKEDVEYFKVDSTPPVTDKNYGLPHYPANINEPGSAYPHWITTKTPITLTATDAKVGVKNTFYRTWVTEDAACNSVRECDAASVPEALGWTTYLAPFNEKEQSCHVIEFYSDDKLGNTEKVKRQCVFVEDTAPVISKEVGTPKVACDKLNPLGCDYYITQQTPITLTCTDGAPHPVDNVSLQYRYSVSNDCKTWGEPTNWQTPTGSFTFPTDSCHKLEYKCADALGNTDGVHTEIDVVDTVAPKIVRDITGPKSGQCRFPQVEGDICFLDGVSQVVITATDPRPHPVDKVTCEWSYKLDNNETVNGPFTSFPINFPEETTHNLKVVCKDALGNTSVLSEVFNVDKTPPATTKTYGKPFFENKAGEWITSKTPITLTVIDAGPHKSGIKSTSYRVTQVADGFCDKASESYCDANGSGNWNTTAYNGEPIQFSIPEQSCHMIEYYSVDNVNKTETTKRQCVYVDNTSPTPVKTVGDPKTPWDANDAIFYPDAKNHCGKDMNCWKVTTMTPITMSCQDPLPHPVRNEIVHYHVEWDAENVTSNYCPNQQFDANGWCITQSGSTLLFREETEHNLAFYCEDALGNTNLKVDDEKFKVEGTAFTIELNKKWNLISVPFSLINDSPEAVFAGVAENVKSVWAYDAFTDKWSVYNPAVPSASNLTEVLPGNGYWLAVFNPDTLVLGGSLFSPITIPPSKEIKHGWNMIGYYGTNGVLKYDGPNLVSEGRPARCALFSLGESLLDKGWTSLFTYWEPSNPNQWIPLNYSSFMNPGAGYWISATEDGLYEYTTVCEGLSA